MKLVGRENKQEEKSRLERKEGEENKGKRGGHALGQKLSSC